MPDSATVGMSVSNSNLTHIIFVHVLEFGIPHLSLTFYLFFILFILFCMNKNTYLAWPSLNANRAQIYGKISQITLWAFGLRLRRGVSPNFQPQQVSLRLQQIFLLCLKIIQIMSKCNFIKEYSRTFREFFQKALVSQTIVSSNNVVHVHVQGKYETTYCLQKSMLMSDKMFCISN